MIFLEQPVLAGFLNRAIPIVKELKAVILTMNCPHCRESVDYPLIARLEDVQALGTLINMADKYLQDKGGSTVMLKEILDELYVSLRRKRFRFIKGGKEEIHDTSLS